MNSKRWLAVIFILGIAIVGLSMLELGNHLVYFYTPAEATAQASQIATRDIRVGGLVQKGSVSQDEKTLDLKFLLTDLKGSEITVTYKGSPPDMFKEGQGVVAEGRITSDGKAMVAKKLMVKHSEEYKKPDDHSSMNAEYLEKSLFKNEQK